jgi:hypothetical protein
MVGNIHRDVDGCVTGDMGTPETEGCDEYELRGRHVDYLAGLLCDAVHETFVGDGYQVDQRVKEKVAQMIAYYMLRQCEYQYSIDHLFDDFERMAETTPGDLSTK